MKTKTWVLLIAAVFAVLCGVSFALYHIRPQSTVANVYQDGVCILSIDLSAVAGTETYTVTDEDGHENTIEVENGRIRISEANCPDQVCVDTGWISGSLKPIVCLPVRLVIQIESDPATEALNLDAVSG
ncbi:MAG: NusG domain II-containing protein [Oscillospiraceae bacterium]|nr:NusG domain II-containing protein [Oscillospiraceae bacterium]